MLTRAGSKVGQIGMTIGEVGILTAAALVLVLVTTGCRKESDDDYQGQIGASVGEVMASADESANASVTTAMMPALPRLLPILRTPAELKGPLWRRAADALLPSAYADSCWPFTFSACTAGVRTETFSDCDFGPSKLDGSVTLTFSDTTACSLVAGDAVNRTANFTLTGPYGGSLAVTSPGGGQTLTHTAAGSFTFAVPGMERVLTGPDGHTLFDISTMTTTALTITGSSRADFAIVGGTLEITHHLAGYSVALTPDNLAWTPSCNCASSGSLTGTVSGGKADGKSATVTLTGCGTADVTIDGQTASVVMDRCATI